MTSELLTRVAGMLSDRAEAAEGSQVAVGEGVVLVEVTHPAHGRLAGADLCFITGSALVYGGVDRYLSVLSEGGVSAVVLVGATASLLPGLELD
jgi:hypothetical protein